MLRILMATFVLAIACATAKPPPTKIKNVEPLEWCKAYCAPFHAVMACQTELDRGCECSNRQDFPEPIPED